MQCIPLPSFVNILLPERGIFEFSLPYSTQKQKKCKKFWQNTVSFHNADSFLHDMNTSQRSPSIQILNTSGNPFAGCPVKIKWETTYANGKWVIDLTRYRGQEILALINGHPYTIPKDQTKRWVHTLVSFQSKRTGPIQVASPKSTPRNSQNIPHPVRESKKDTPDT